MKLARSVQLFFLGFVSVQTRWATLCETNRAFQRAHRAWRRERLDSPEEKDAYEKVKQLREKLHFYGESLGMSDVATELPLPQRYRSQGTPPVPTWLLVR